MQSRHIDLPRHELIKARLRIAGANMAQIGRELGVSHTTISSVSQGYSRSRRVEEAIAAKLSVGPESVWPERYENKDEDGAPMK
ncbi:helix-turn-helix domain-containing protein [Thioclava kandeliae]|uniref:helix-turn-helix domain-containing protein n=1 Tax=Thioclava kandeliae TaxID=3070818 RepID=UPI0033219860